MKVLLKFAFCASSILLVAFYFTGNLSQSRVLLRRKLELRREDIYDGINRFEGYYDTDDTESLMKKKIPQNENDLIQNVQPSHVAASEVGRYILTQSFGGQMTRAIKNMMLQQCVAGLLAGPSSNIVEPFSANSDLYHSPRFWKDLETEKIHEAPRFSDFYDLEYYNQKSKEDGSAQLVTWQYFLTNAPRNAVVLVLPQRSCANNTQEDASRVNLSSHCTFSKDFDNFITELKRYNFVIKKVICVSCTGEHRPLTMSELYRELYPEQNVTVLVNLWGNLKKTSGWLQVPHVCNSCEASSTLTRLRHSSLVDIHTQYYKDNIIQSKRYIAVMLRIERFLTDQKIERTNVSLSSCINSALEIHDQLKRGTPNNGTFLTLDVGRFGSHIMQKTNAVSKLAANVEHSVESITSLAEVAVSHLYSGKYTLDSWEDTFVEASGGITEMGYIATLQRDIATKADCLILMGGGYYQQVAAYQYIKHHPNRSSRCLFTVCVKSDFDVV